MSELHGVFFDAGNTLLFVDRERLFRAFREVGIESDEARFDAVEYRARHRLARRASEGAAGTEAHIWTEYFGTIFRGCGVPEESVPVVAERVLAMHRELGLWTRVLPGTGEALGALRAHGLRLGVISNADGRVDRLLERAGLLPFFELVLDSAVVGVEKPDPRIFHIALEETGLRPEETLYVGDLYHVDVLGARSAGMRAVLVDPVADHEYACERIGAVTELPDYLGLDDGAGRGARPRGEAAGT